MMKVVLALLLAPAAAFVAPATGAAGVAVHETKADLECGWMDYREKKNTSEYQALAKDLNPIVGFWDPLTLASQSFWGKDEASTIGFLRHSEIKHGRVAMAAFSGYCVQSNGIKFPWPMTVSGEPFPAAATPPEQWDALPLNGKLQILSFIGFLEFYSEIVGPHYMKGGVPGKFPSFKATAMGGLLPVDLYDPMGLWKDMTPEKSARGLKAEVNNGRLAMLGIFGFLCESKIAGSVPVISAFIKPYAGDYMGPF